VFLIFQLIETKPVRFEAKIRDLIQAPDFAVFPGVIVPAQTKRSV